MAILEGLVIATIVLAGAWIGYHAWQDSLHETVEKHDITIKPEIFSQKIQIEVQPVKHMPKSTLG